jgi:hypothetical protein
VVVAADAQYLLVACLELGLPRWATKFDAPCTSSKEPLPPRSFHSTYSSARLVVDIATFGRAIQGETLARHGVSDDQPMRTQPEGRFAGGSG